MESVERGVSGVCVTIDHFRRLRAQLALGPLCAHRQHVKDAETSQNKSQETSWLFVQEQSLDVSAPTQSSSRF